MAKPKFPRRASPAPVAQSRSAPESKGDPIMLSHNTAPDVSSAEFSALVDILTSGIPAESPAPIRNGLAPSFRTRTDWDAVESLNHPLATAEPSMTLLAHSIEHSRVRTSTHPSPAEQPPLALASQSVSIGTGSGNMASDVSGAKSNGSPSADVSTYDAAALRYVGRSLATVESGITLLAHSTGVLMPLAIRHVLKAEMARAAGLLQLLRFLKNDLSPVTSAVFSGAVVQRVLRSAESERCLRGIALASSSSVNGVSLVADEALLANLLLGAVLTTFTLLDGIESPKAYLVVAGSDNGEVALAVTQEQATAPEGWPTHPVGESWTDAAGGALSAITMSAGQRIAQAWGGRFAVSTAERSTSISISLPAI